MTAQDVNTQLQWQGDWDVLERRMGDLIIVFLNSTGRMDPKMDNGQANASSRLPAVFLIESGVADMVAIADAQVDSAKWHNVNMYCKKREVAAFYGPTSNAVCKMENIVSAQGTSLSTSGGTLLLMTNMVAGHMCQMQRQQTVGPRWFRQNLRLVAGMGRVSGLNENHHDGRSDYMPGPRTRMDNH